MLNFTQIRRLGLFVSVLFGLSGLAFAHSGAMGVVKERMDLMKSIAEEMKTIGMMIKGEDAFDAARISNAAQMIVQHAKMVPQMFPEGSVEAPSDAVPAIWQQWETFLQHSEDLELRAGELSAAAAKAADVSEVRQHFAAVGKTCSGCHEDFRENK